MTKEIDQRAQRHDPASRHTHDSNDRPGKIDEVESGPDQIAAADGGRTKYNVPDDGHGEVTTDVPLPYIKAKEGPSEGPVYKEQVRPAGTGGMTSPPREWGKEEEESDESFPASDPPGNY